MDNYRGYRITCGRIGRGGVDGYAIYKGLKFIFAEGTFKKLCICKSYWKFWKEKAKTRVDKLISSKKEVKAKAITTEGDC